MHVYTHGNTEIRGDANLVIFLCFTLGFVSGFLIWEQISFKSCFVISPLVFKLLQITCTSELQHNQIKRNMSKSLNGLCVCFCIQRRSHKFVLHAEIQRTSCLLAFENNHHIKMCVCVCSGERCYHRWTHPAVQLLPLRQCQLFGTAAATWSSCTFCTHTLPFSSA